MIAKCAILRNYTTIQTSFPFYVYNSKKGSGYVVFGEKLI